MPRTLDQIKADIQALPADAQDSLIAWMREPDPEVMREWLEVSLDRLAKMESGEDPGVSAEDAIAELRAELGITRASAAVEG